ncbi:hypothetical protein [Amycolatopsis sp. NPDC054798]
MSAPRGTSRDVIRRDACDGVPDGFFDIAPLVYGGDDRWIPEERRPVERAFSAQNGWFGKGRSCTFHQPGLNRLAAFASPEMRIGGRPVAFFGYWETRACPDDDARLFAHAAEWCRSQGAVELWGPVNFTTAGQYRILLSHEHEFLPFLGEPYNPPDYPRRLARCGFTLAKTYFSTVCTKASLRNVISKLGAARARLADSGFRFESMASDRSATRLPGLLTLVNESFSDSLAFVPHDTDSFQASIDNQLPVIDRHASSFCLDKNGNVAGYLIVMPDYGPVLTQGSGESRVAASSLTYDAAMPVLARKREARLVIKTAVVSPRYRERGILQAMAYPALAGPDSARYTKGAIAALMREGNHSRKVLHPFREAEREYGLFRISL